MTDNLNQSYTLKVSNFSVDTNPPKVLSVTSDNDDGFYFNTESKFIKIDVNFDEIIHTGLNVKLKLNLGDPKKEILHSMQFIKTLTFDYPLSVNDSALGLNYNSVDSLTGEVKDKANNSSSLNFQKSTR